MSARAEHFAPGSRGALTGGFTLVEVLVVVVIIAIAASIVVPQISAAGSLTIQAAARHVIADLLVAQNEAIAAQATRKMIFDVTNNGYRLTDGSDQTLASPWEANADYVVNFNDDSRFDAVTLKAVDFKGGTEVGFDALAAPTSGGTIDLQSNDDRFQYRITVTEFTGRVTVAPLEGG